MPDIKRLPLDSTDPLGIALLIGPDDPSGVSGGVAGAKGSPYIRETNGQWYTKFGPGNSEWAPLATSSGYLPLAGGDLTAAAVLGWTGRSKISSSSDGTILLTNNGAAGFGRLQFGGITSSFPAIRRTGAAIDIVTADDSFWADLNANLITSNNNGFKSAGSAGQYQFQDRTTGSESHVLYADAHVGRIWVGSVGDVLKWSYATGALTALFGLTVGSLVTTGDIHGSDLYAVRTGALTTGVIYLGNSGTRFLYYDGSQYNLPSAPLQVSSLNSAGIIGVSVTTATAFVSNTTTNSTSDYTQWIMQRGAVNKWRIGMNIVGTGVDEFNLYAEASGICPIRILTSGAISFWGPALTLNTGTPSWTTSGWNRALNIPTLAAFDFGAGSSFTRYLMGASSGTFYVAAPADDSSGVAVNYLWQLNPSAFNCFVPLIVGGRVTATEFYDSVSGGRLGMVQVSTSAPPASLPAGSIYIWVT